MSGRNILLVGLLWGCALATLGFCAGDEPAAPNASRSAPARGARRPLSRNIFFPTSHMPPPWGLSAVPAGAGGEAKFVLAGTIASADGKAALLEYPATGRLVWVRRGDRIDGLTVADVTDRGVVFELGAQRLALAIGRPEADLLAGRRILRGGFELVGVCRGDREQFALVQMDGDASVRRITVRDRLEAGVVAAIADDGIVVKVGGDSRLVAVGGRFDARTPVQ